MKTLVKFLEMNCMMKVLITGIMLITLIETKAQETDDNITRPVQITLISPVGSNGMQSPEITNNFSLNLIAGYAGGVDGVEIGAFTNILKYNMNGVQIAGFANLVKGSTTGAQIAGFMNLNKADVTGTQVAGFTNIVAGNINAVQVSGFINYTHGKADKAQVAGFANVAKDDVNALQIAGFTNLTSGSMNGCQISGFLNYAKALSGVQIGVVNVADTVEKGVPIGVFSWVKDGYRAIEIGSSETIHGQVSFKTGTRNFYNIFSIGGIANNKNAWAVGYGVGSMLPVSQKIDASIEAVAYHLNEDQSWTEQLNMLNKINLSLSYKLNNTLSVYGGASLNVAVSALKDAEGNLSGSDLIPYHYYNKNHNGTNVKIYPGFNVGLRMRL